MIDFLDVLIKVAVLLALAIPGFVCRKIKLLGEGSVKTLSVVLLYVCTPFQMITSFQGTPFSTEILLNVLWAFLFAFVSQALMYVILVLCFRKSKKPRSVKGAYIYACTFGNCGYMGIPFLQMLGLNEAVIYAAAFLVAFNLLSWTVGVFAMSGDRKFISVKKALLNPPTVALLVAVPLFCLNVDLAAVCPSVYKGVTLLSDMTMPLAMMTLGVRLADLSFRQVFADGPSYLFTAVRLVLNPLLMLAMIVFLPLSPALKTALFLISSMPSASATLGFAERFGGDTTTAARITLITSALSVVTIPVLSFLLALF